MEISELTRWLLLGFISEDELLKDWKYHCSANYEILKKYIDGARSYGNGDSEKEISFLEIRLPLVLYTKDRVAEEQKFCIEFYRMEGNKVRSTIRTHALDFKPSPEYAEQLMKHLRAQCFMVKDIEY
ncbi:hypothetical protein EHV15_35430 [Paenibacillus oralis]|uniref:Uncharacterized protein n=1 Tax=Paenibacillus oralis TaxID=2490856 RepID=A0A3P3TCN6_9BACL|nr:hypothetical protein [Paenibacillus oralis]RRJ54868.1 hypothetical protein EHV15_35430 [Paenibacillus oralis]